MFCVPNGRNEIVSAGGTSFSYDNNRNVTNDGTRAYAYDAANQLTSAGSTSFSYDPSGALYDVGAYRLATVGGERLALYTTSGGALHRRIVPGASFDEAAAYYHGSGTTTRQWPLADQLGSVVAYANASGAAANINTYDEYGRPGSGNAEFLQYTDQLAIASAPGVYNYRNRFYQADVGRFLQTDPILYGDGLNLYAYVGNDPINRIDPWGAWEVYQTTICAVSDDGFSGTCRIEIEWTWDNEPISDSFNDWRDFQRTVNKMPALDVVDAMTAYNGYRMCPVAEVALLGGDRFSLEVQGPYQVSGNVRGGGTGGRFAIGLGRGGFYSQARIVTGWGAAAGHRFGSVGVNYGSERPVTVADFNAAREGNAPEQFSVPIFIGVGLEGQIRGGASARAGIEIRYATDSCPGEK